MGQKIQYGSEARKEMYEGVKLVNDAVKVTLGPSGKCVVISKLYEPFYNGIKMPLQLSKDGYRVSKSINLDGDLQNIGQRLIQEAAQKTVDQAGDATTTTCILMEAIVREGLKLIDEGANSQEIKKGIDIAVEYVVSRLKEMAVPVGGDLKKIFEVATVSANNDSYIGGIISEAYKKIGNDGIIDVQEGQGVETEVKISDGFKIDRGWLSHHFLTNKEKLVCEFENPYIILYEKKITHHKQIEKALKICADAGRAALIICEDAEEEGLAFLAINNFEKRIKCCVVKSPSFGDRRREEMEDIATLVGATYMSDTKGVKITEIEPKHLGNALKVIVSKDDTVIIAGDANKQDLEDLVNELRMNLTQAKSPMEKEPIERRIAKLTGGVAIINVGAATETEMKERLDRFDDSCRATKAAIAEGYVPGGGTAFLRVGQVPTSETNLDRNLGIQLIEKILSSPLEQLCINRDGGESGLFSIVEKVKNEKGDMGYNAKTGIIEDLVVAGIIDAVKVNRCAIQNAASAAGNLLITEAVIADKSN